MLGKLPRLNVFRMVAGAPGAARPFLQLGSAVLSGALDARRREIAVLGSRIPRTPLMSRASTSISPEMRV